MTDWNPQLYRQFETERTRPASDLLAQVPTQNPRHIADLGCGPGNSTELLVKRFPNAKICGIDNSAAMLATAQTRLPDSLFQQADIHHWQPEQAQDLIYANASLQWLDNHGQLFPQLFHHLAAGGTLAVQMPDNWEEPSHRLMREVAKLGPWRDKIAQHNAGRVKVLNARQYYDLLAPLATQVNIWRTTYYHIMPSAEAILDWVRATGLRPFIDPLAENQQQDFIREYLAALEVAYRPQADGRRLFAFPRLFIVAQRAS